MVLLVALIILIISRTKCAEEKLNGSTNSHKQEDGCFIGQVLKNGWVEDTKPPFRKLATDEYVDTLQSVIYKCNDNYFKDGTTINTCFKGKWIYAIPECKPYCSPKEISSISFVPQMCSLNGVERQCSDPAPPGTKAYLNCRKMYHLESNISEQVTSCEEDGIWNPPPQECSISCGILTQNITTNPWSVDIISLTSFLDSGVAGTIINARMVLTTAITFWNHTQQKTKDLSQFQVLVGLLQTIDQRIGVKRVAYAPNFNRKYLAPSGNVVVVVLSSSIDFQSGVVPVCLPFDRHVEAEIRSSFMTRNFKQKFLELSTDCYWELDSKLVSLPAIDIICTKQLNDTLLFKHTHGYSVDVPIEKNGERIFYMVGVFIIVDTRVDTSDDRKEVVFYQNILFYKNFIENEINYENTKEFQTATVSSSFVASRRWMSTTSSSIINQTDYCRADIIPNRGNAYYESTEQQIEFGEIIQNSFAIVYRCIENHILYGDSTNVCQDGKWTHSEPECKPRCNPKEIQGLTLVANCEFREGQTLRQTLCTEPAAPGTIATINCQLGYERFGSFQQTATCGSDGRWSPLPEKCTQICGEISQGGAYIIGGRKTDISKVPWHAGIYRKYGSNRVSEQICGGSIITAKIVVSAIHCFWDGNAGTVNNKDEYDVAVGKSLRRFDQTEDLKPQFFKVENIFYDEGYNDIAGHFTGDIAILILDKIIEFKSYIAPVCIQFDLKYDERYVQSEQLGKVAGWGLEDTNADPSPILKEIELPVTGKKECRERSSMEFVPFITSDKFCVAYVNRMGPCQGDSGGGYVTSQSKGNKDVYYLRGIVSSGANKQGSCDNDQFVLFTNVAYYSDLIKKYYLQYQPIL